MNKKALSAFLAMSSMAGVMAPSMTAFAAEENKNTVEDLITYAKNAKDLYHYNQAYAAIMADKDNANFNTWLGELAPVAKEIKGYDEMMKIIAEIQDEVQKNQSIEQYNAVVAKVQSLFDNGSICKTDKEYLDAELVYWTRTPIFTTQSDLKTVIDKTNEAAKLLADGKAREAQTAIEAAQAVLAGQNNINQANETYLQNNTVAPVAQNVADAVAKLPIELVSATAINPMEFEVKFDAPVDRDTAIDQSNYQISINGNSVTDKTADYKIINTKLNADGTAVIFRLNQAMSNGTKYSISISNGIYSVAKDKKVALTQGTEQQFNDTQAPTLVSANQDVEKDNTIDLVFNEPVSSIGGLKIDGKTVIKKAININYKDNTITNEDGAVDNVTITNEAGNYKVKVTLPETMSKDTINKITALGNHNVIAYNVADTCASMQNTAVTLTTQYDVTVNALTPEVTNVKADEDNDREFYIEFNKDIDINTVQPGNLTVKKGDVKYNQATTPTITVEGWDMDNNVATAVGKTNVKAIKVTIGADTDDYKLYKDDEKSVNLSVKLENYKTSAGYIGDKFKGNVTLSKDAAGPQIKLDQCELNNTAKPNEAAKYEGINVVFNKAVTNVQPSKINVTDKNGITRTVKTATSNNTDTVTIKLADFTSNDYSNKAPFTVTFEDGAVQKYVAGAVESPVYNSEQQVTVYDESTVTPELLLNENDVDSHINTVDGIVTNIITINYRKEMSATAVDLNNYTLDGQALPKGTKISMGADNKTVTITLPEGSISENATNMFVISKNVKTVEGSVVVGKLTNHQAFNKAIELKDSVKPTLESAEYVLIDNANDKATNMIRVKFSENLLNNLQENGKELDGKNVTAEAAKANIAKAITNFKIKVNNNDQTIATIGRFDNNANTLDIVLSNEVKIDSNSVISVVPVGTDDNAAMFISDEAGNTLAQNGDDVKVSGTEQGNASEIAAIKAQQEVEAKAAAQVKVNAIASAITKVDAPAVDANKLTMPNVPDGYTIAIKSSSNEGVIAKNGTITPPDDATSVKLVFTVTNTATKAEADTQEITVEVPASQAKAAAKEEAAKQEAAKKANQKSVDDAKSEVKNIELTKGSKLTEDKKTDVENAIKAKLTDKDITVKAEKVDDNNYKVTLTKGADKTEGTTTIAKVPVTVAS